MKLYTALNRKPIPIRSCDWECWDDTTDEFGSRGFGRTEEAAITDFLETRMDEFEKWNLDTYGEPCIDDAWPDRWDEWKAQHEVERL